MGKSKAIKGALEAASVAAKKADKPNEQAVKMARQMARESKYKRIEPEIRQRGGQFAVRRLEQAFDEIPRLESQFSDEALIYGIAPGDNAASLMIMRPGDFERFAEPLNISGNEMTKGIKTLDEYVDELGQIARKRGFEDVPFLQIGEIPDTQHLEITGHEGRHRMRALNRLGDEATLVRTLPRSSVREELPRRSAEEYLRALVEKYGDPLLVRPEDTTSEDMYLRRFLPKQFAEGGTVDHKLKEWHAAQGGEVKMRDGGNPDFQGFFETENSIESIPVSDEILVGRGVRRKRPKIGEIFETPTYAAKSALGAMGSAAKGAAQATVGLPGDIEMIGRGVGQAISPESGEGRLDAFLRGMEAETYLLTTEDIKAKIDPYLERFGVPATMDQFETLGEFAGIPISVGAVKRGAGAVKEAVQAIPQTLATPPVGSVDLGAIGKPEKLKAPADDLGFYSQAEKASLNLQRKQGTGDAFLNDLKRGGVSNEELEFSGLQSFLSGQTKVTKEDIQEFIEANRYKFSEIQLESAKGDQAEMKFRGDAIDDPDYISSNADDIFDDFDSYNPGRRDEIAQRIYDEYTPEELADPAIKADIDSKIDDNIRQEAYDIAYSQYWDNPYYRYENDLGYEILGNDEMGYTVRDADGRPVGDYFRTQEEAEGAANTHAIDMGLVSEGQTLFHDYQLPLGENYREIWIQYQPQPNPALTKREQAQLEGLYEKFRKSIGPDKDRPVMTPEDTANFNRLKTKTKLANERDEYNESHIDEPDVIAHLRLQDRITTDGKPMLYVDELQSDWHQQGADRGYRTPENMANADEIRKTYQQKSDAQRNADIQINLYRNRRASEISENSGSYPSLATVEDIISIEPEYKRLVDNFEKAEAERRVAKKPYDKLNELLPNAPLKETWHKLGLKRALNYAAQNGYDRVGFSAASPQIKRWGTQEIAWEKTEDGWNVSATEQKGGLAGRMNLEAEARARGILKERKSVPIKTQAELRDLVESIGRRLSENQIDRITKKTWDRMQKFGTGVSAPREEGMLAFYDNKLKKALQDYAKQMGGTFYETTTKVGRGVSESGGYADLTEPVYVVEFTPELKESALKGQSYKKGGAVTKDHKLQEWHMRKMARGGLVKKLIAAQEKLRNRYG